MFGLIKKARPTEENAKLQVAFDKINVLEEGTQKLIGQVESLTNTMTQTTKRIHDVSLANAQLTLEIQAVYDLMKHVIAVNMQELEEQDIHGQYGMWYCINDDDLPN